MLIHKGANPAQAVIGTVLFSFDGQGRCVSAHDPTTGAPATEERVQAAIAAAPRFPKFFEVLPDEKPARAEEPTDDPEDDEDKPRRRRRKE
jgi:hypothetical protein